MKVIFLDIDGVLVHSETVGRSKGIEGEVFASQSQIDMECCKRLKSIIDATQAKIVLSSIWRILDSKVVAIERALKSIGLSRVIIDSTSNISQNRSLEVSEWISKHPDIQYICIDDGMIEGHPTLYILNGYFSGGLQDHHIAEAILMLNGH